MSPVPESGAENAEISSSRGRFLLSMVQVVLTNEVTVSGNCGADVIALLDEIQSVKIGVVKTTSADGLAASVTPG